MYIKNNNLNSILLISELNRPQICDVGLTLTIVKHSSEARVLTVTIKNVFAIILGTLLERERLG